MANQLDMQILESGPRNTVIKLTGVLGDSDIYETPAIGIGDLASSTNDDSLKLIGFRVDLIEYSISQGLEVILEWAGFNPQVIVPLAGRGKIMSYTYGGMMPDQTRLGYTGDINLKTIGFATGPQTFSILLELVKLYKSGI